MNNLIAKYKEKIMEGVFFGTALFSIFAVILICIFLFAGGVPAIAKIGAFSFLFGSEWAPTILFMGFSDDFEVCMRYCGSHIDWGFDGV